MEKVQMLQPHKCMCLCVCGGGDWISLCSSNLRNTTFTVYYKYTGLRSICWHERMLNKDHFLSDPLVIL